MSSKLVAFHEYLTRQITSIDFGGPESMESAKYVRDISATVSIGSEYIDNMISVTKSKLDNIGTGGDPTFVEPTFRFLTEAVHNFESQKPALQLVSTAA